MTLFSRTDRLANKSFPFLPKIGVPLPVVERRASTMIYYQTQLDHHLDAKWYAMSTSASDSQT